MDAVARRPCLCLIAHSRYPIGEPRVERAAKAARDDGYEVHVISLRGLDEPRQELIDGIQVRRLPVRHIRGATVPRMFVEYVVFVLLSSLRVLDLHRRRSIDVVEIHAPPDFLVLAGIVPRLLGAGLVLDIRDISSHLWGARFGDDSSLGRIIKAVLQGVERIACGMADQVITVHEPYRQELASHGVQLAKIAVVMNAPEESLIERATDVHYAPSEHSRFTVAYHGTITEWYGVELLVRAVAEVGRHGLEIRALVLGEGDRLPAAHGLTQSLGIEDGVFFSDQYLPIEEALRRVANADCGIIPNLPSEFNRFILPNKLFEYVALGIPVVTARLETIAAHFGDEDVTFFRPGNLASLTEAILWVAGHRDEAIAKAVRARETALAYSWCQNRRQYLTTIENVGRRPVSDC